VCRALLVMCAAEDADALAALKAAVVSAEWELTAGATSLEQARRQLEEERPHVLVAFGEWPELVSWARERWPRMRIVTDRQTPGADVAATSLEEVRDAVADGPRPGGPVRS
jgi:hypothetical protein